MDHRVGIARLPSLWLQRVVCTLGLITVSKPPAGQPSHCPGFTSSAFVSLLVILKQESFPSAGSIWLV